MKFYIIGLDDNREQFFEPKVLNKIAGGKIFSGGIRHHEIVSHLLPTSAIWIDITVPLDNVFRAYEPHQEIIVFASGDPLFFGFANTIQKRLPKANIEVYPFFNSLQTLAHRITLAYQEMHSVSLTGRKWKAFDAALIEGRTLIGILTDREKTPSAIASRMLAYGYNNYQMTVGELLGNKDKEQIHQLSIEKAAQLSFAAPNCVILQRLTIRPRPFGIPEEEFNLLDGRVKMITKMPIRMLTLSLLDLRNRNVFWDIGFCTGSVSIEAKLQFPNLDIIAFEQREKGEGLMEMNSKKFGTPGIQTIIGDFVQTDISNLNPPDAVFIGGHGGKLVTIIKRVEQILSPQGVIVFNSVSNESRELFMKAIQQVDMELLQSSQITVDNFNTIEIMKAARCQQA